MSVIDRLEELKQRATELEEIREKLWDLMGMIEEVESYLPADIMGSHHAEMEYGDTLEQVENELQAIEDKVNQ
tara:strand:- start:450 stop:668 length:219 start_codon:yes stop_codon:yes gene_type:complete